MRWITPVTDRTEEDVAFARDKIQEWIAAQTAETYDLKGCLCLNDLNRIEGNIAYLNDLLTGLYYPPGASCRTWEMKDLPTVLDVERILDNVKCILAVYYRPTGLEDLPDGMGTHVQINLLETYLARLKELLDWMQFEFQKSGMFRAGARRRLPLKR